MPKRTLEFEEDAPPTFRGGACKPKEDNSEQEDSSSEQEDSEDCTRLNSYAESCLRTKRSRYESKRLIVRVADYDDIDEETLQKIEKEPHRYHIIIEEPDEEDLFDEMETAFA